MVCAELCLHQTRNCLRRFDRSQGQGTIRRGRDGQVIFKGNGRAVIAGEDSGFVKFVVSADGLVRGVHMISPAATELISGVTLGLEQGMTLQQWAEVIYPHPTVSESIKETLLSVRDRITFFVDI